MKNIATFLLFIPFAACTLQFQELSYLKFSDTMFQDNATRSAYHTATRMLYIIGETTKTIHIVDLTNPMSPIVRFTHVFDDVRDGRLTDIAVCGDIFATSLTDTDVIDSGHIYFYNIYYQQDTSLSQIGDRVEVGSYPKRIAFVSDCTRLLVANEGRPAPNPNTLTFEDPLGSITIVKYFAPTGAQARAITRTQDFTSYDDSTSLADLLSRGIRFVFRENNGQFSQDAEPDSVVIDDRDEVAYIILQENNAVVRYNLTTELIIDIQPFGEKDWNNYDMDASDVDGATLKRHDIHSFYQPGDVKFVRVQNTGYLLTANTGAVKHYTNGGESFEFNEAQRTRILYETDPDLFNLNTIPAALQAKMQDDNELGRLYISTLDGKDVSLLIDSLKTYGGRSITMWNAASISFVYDSGQSMENEAADNSTTTTTANGECSEPATSTPISQADLRSDDLGVEPTSVDVGDFGTSGMKAVVVGTGTSQLYLYSLTGTSLFYQTVYRAGGIGLSWAQLQTANLAGNAIITDVKYFDAATSPDRSPMAVAISSGSSSLQVLRVYDDGTTRK